MHAFFARTGRARALGAAIALCACTENGQTGSPAGIGGGGAAGSFVGCNTCNEQDCITDISARFTRELGPQPQPIAVVGSECVELTLRQPIDPGPHSPQGLGYDLELRGPLCACRPDHDGGPYYIASEPVGCAVRGHAHDCLMTHGMSEPCDPSDPAACESVCAELDAQLEADARTSKPFVVRSARCGESELFADYVATECSEAVIEIDGHCYDAMNVPLDWNNWQSCGLDYQEIVNAPRQVLPDCDDIPESVPETADCRPACDNASDCKDAQGCDYGPSGAGFGRSGRGYCYACGGDEDCLAIERCVVSRCVLRDNVECESDIDCPAGEWCEHAGFSSEGRGNEALEYRCVPEP